MIDFPASPTIGQTFTDPTTNLEWVWDGTKWVASGLANAPFMPLFGVTDGSNAVAGQIGEVLQVLISAAVTLTNSVQTNVGSIALPPGDWDLTGELWITHGNSPAPTVLQTSLATTSGAFPAAPALNNTRHTLQAPFIGTIQILPLRTIRVSLAASATFYLLGYAVYAAGGSATGNGVISARRAR